MNLKEVVEMAFKGKGFVLAGLAVGAASVLSKKDNRSKLMGYINSAKDKMNTAGGIQSIKKMVEDNAAEKTLKVKPDIGGITSSSGNFISEYDDTKEVKEERSHLTTNLEEIIEQKASFTDTARSSELEANHMSEEGRTQTLIDAYNILQEEEADSTKYN